MFKEGFDDSRNSEVSFVGSKLRRFEASEGSNMTQSVLPGDGTCFEVSKCSVEKLISTSTPHRDKTEHKNIVSEDGIDWYLLGTDGRCECIICAKSAGKYDI